MTGVRPVDPALWRFPGEVPDVLAPAGPDEIRIPYLGPLTRPPAAEPAGRRPPHRDEPEPPGDDVPRACKRPRYGTSPTVWYWKYRYHTAGGAQSAARRVLPGKTCTVYECGFCGWWHFGGTRRTDTIPTTKGNRS